MRQLVLTYILWAFCPLFINAGADWTASATRMRQSIVPILIQTEDGVYGCTGWVVNASAPNDTDYIAVAAHCDKGALYVDGAPPMRIVFKDPKDDLMVLQVPDTGKPALFIAAHDPQEQETVLSIGYGDGLERAQTRRANISAVGVVVPRLSGTFVMIDAPFKHGMSGGPVVNANGEVVMIVQYGDDESGLGRGADKLRDRIGKYAEKPKAKP